MCPTDIQGNVNLDKKIVFIYYYKIHQEIYQRLTIKT